MGPHWLEAPAAECAGLSGYRLGLRAQAGMRGLERIAIIVLAHNEERRIARCMASLPRGAEGVAVHVVVNGSSARTAEIARGFAGVGVHDWAEGGKSRS